MGREVKVAWHPVNLECASHSASLLLIHLSENILSFLLVGHTGVVVYFFARQYILDQSLLDVNLVDLQNILNVEGHERTGETDELNI